MGSTDDPRSHRQPLQGAYPIIRITKLIILKKNIPKYTHFILSSKTSAAEIYISKIERSIKLRIMGIEFR